MNLSMQYACSSFIDTRSQEYNSEICQASIHAFLISPIYVNSILTREGPFPAWFLLPSLLSLYQSPDMTDTYVERWSLPSPLPSKKWIPFGATEYIGGGGETGHAAGSSLISTFQRGSEGDYFLRL